MSEEIAKKVQPKLKDPQADKLAVANSSCPRFRAESGGESENAGEGTAWGYAPSPGPRAGT